MLRKYGKDVVDDLESREFESKKWTREELIAIRKYYGDKIKRLERGEAPLQPSDTGMAVLDMFTDMGETGEVPGARLLLETDNTHSTP